MTNTYTTKFLAEPNTRYSYRTFKHVIYLTKGKNAHDYCIIIDFGVVCSLWREKKRQVQDVRETIPYVTVHLVHTHEHRSWGEAHPRTHRRDITDSVLLERLFFLVFFDGNMSVLIPFTQASRLRGIPRETGKYSSEKGYCCTAGDESNDKQPHREFPAIRS